MKTKIKVTKPVLYVFYSVFLILIISFSVVGYQKIVKNNNTVVDSDLTIVSIDELTARVNNTARINRNFMPDRDGYGIGEFTRRNENGSLETVGYHIKEAMSLLPPLPSNFGIIKFETMSGHVQPEFLDNLGSEYYEQPEFYSDSFEARGIPLHYRTPSLTRYGEHGYGNFPHEWIFDVRPGANFSIVSFVHAGFGVQNYQGYAVFPVYPVSQLTGKGGGKIDVHNGKEYIKLSIENNSEFLLSPTYPKFFPGWTHKVKLNVNVSHDTPLGVYGVGFDIGGASTYQSTVWRNQYRGNYFGGNSFKPTDSLLKVAVYVSE